MNIGISGGTTEDFAVKLPTTRDILGGISSGLGLDIAKNHSGITLWDGKNIERYGFALSDYDKSNPHAEYIMRKELKDKLSSYLSGKSFEYIVIEDVYGGENFDTVRKLIALNTVIDELIFDGVVQCENFFRWKESTWLKHFRKLLKLKGKPNVKFETQQILKYLNDDFFIANEDLSNGDKKRIFFEDICDSTAMLLSVVMYVTGNKEKKERQIFLKDVKMYYLNDESDYSELDDYRVLNEPISEVSNNFYNIEEKILSEVRAHPEEILIMDLPVAKLGSFGIKHNFTFYEDGNGVLIFYNKRV